MPKKRYDSSWIGRKFNKWEIIGGPVKKGANLYFLCECDCGKINHVHASSLTNGHSSKCRECGNNERPVKHGDNLRSGKKRLYTIWASMRDRCLNPNDTAYKYYGAKGIAVSDQWVNYENFKKWALKNGYREDLEIDRKNNNGGYFPENCRWITHKKNMRNRRNSFFIEAFGERKCISAWVEDIRCKIVGGTLWNRIKAGWIPEEAIVTLPWGIRS